MGWSDSGKINASLSLISHQPNIDLICLYTKVPYEVKYQSLRAQSCRLYNNKYIIASMRVTNTEIFAFIAVLVFKLLTQEVLFLNRKGNRNCYKVGYILGK